MTNTWFGENNNCVFAGISNMWQTSFHSPFFCPGQIVLIRVYVFHPTYVVFLAHDLKELLSIDWHCQFRWNLSVVPNIMKMAWFGARHSRLVLVCNLKLLLSFNLAVHNYAMRRLKWVIFNGSSVRNACWFSFCVFLQLCFRAPNLCLLGICKSLFPSIALIWVLAFCSFFLATCF